MRSKTLIIFLILMLSTSLAYAYRITKPLPVTDYDERALVIINDTFQKLWDITNGRIEELYKVKIGDVSSGNYTDISACGDISFNGTAGIVIPHLMQSDNTDQTIASTTADQIITFDTDVHHAGISRTSSSRFTILKKGSYLVTFSAIVLSGVAGKKFVVWMKKNGVNVDDSSTYYIFKSANANTVVTVTFIYHFEVGDYFELWMYGNDLGVKLDYTAAVAANPGVTPAIPVCPSIIMTCNYIGKD